MRVTVDTSGLDRLLSRLGDVKKAGSKAMADGAAKDSQRIVPVDTGRLKSSMKVETRGDKSTVTYGGNRAEYAPIVHNRPGFAKSGQSQFLRTPLMNARKRLRDAARAVEQTLRD